VPPGTNEGNLPVPPFTLTAGATTDEGNNWINISWGPLSMTNPATGAVLGNYSLATGSPAIDYITLLNSGVSYLAAPSTDFFGNPRKAAGNLAVDAGAVEGGIAGGGGGNGNLSVAPTALAFGNVAVNTNSLSQTLTLTNNTGAAVTGIVVTPATTSTPNTPNVFTRSGGTCGTTLNNASSCTIIVVFRPVAVAAYTGTVGISASVGVSGSPVSLTGNGINPTAPMPATLDNFNRANATNLGGNWLQLGLGALAAIQVNANQAFDPLTAGTAFWNLASFGARQAAAFTIANTTLNNDALILAATGTPVLSTYPNFIRVLYNNTNNTVTVATTTNGGLTYTTVGSFAGTFANGDKITAMLDGTNAVAAPTVYVWRTTSANVTTFVGSVQITSSPTWTAGGRIGVQMPAGARIDNFSGGTTP
jgi:hypothetical protein